MVPLWGQLENEASITFFTGQLNPAGLTDALVPGETAEVRVRVSGDSVIESGSATVTLSEHLEYIGYPAQLEPWDSIEHSGQALSVSFDEHNSSAFNIRFYVKVKEIDELPAEAPSFTVSVQSSLVTRLGGGSISASQTGYLLYTRASIQSDKDGKEVQAGDRIQYFVTVDPYPHYELVASQVSASVPYGTRIVQGSLAGLPDASVGTGTVSANYPDGGSRGFTFSFTAEVWSQVLLDYAGIESFDSATVSGRISVRTPYTGNKNSAGAQFHRREVNTAASSTAFTLEERVVGGAVNSTGDRPRDPTRDDSGTGHFLENGDPEITLRSLIEGVNAGLADRVTFAIEGADIPTIELGSPLPEIARPVEIDGTTQSGGMVEVRGNGMNAVGLDLLGGQSEVRGLILHGFTGTDAAAIRIRGEGGNAISGNWLGLTKDGLSASLDEVGLRIDGSAENVVGGQSADDRNLIFGSDTCVTIGGEGADGNAIAGNWIGLNKDGKSLEAGVGVSLNYGIGNRIGEAGSGNTIASIVGVLVASGGGPLSDTSITGNRIGLEGDGTTAAFAGGGFGVLIVAVESEPVEGASIVGNSIAGVSCGIFLGGDGVLGSLVQDNRLGLDFGSFATLPAGLDADFQEYGIRIDGAPNTTVADNRVAGYLVNAMASGLSQFYITPLEDTNGDGESDQGGDLILLDLENQRQGDPDETRAGGIVFEGNAIGFDLGGSTPQGLAQGYGIALFGEPQGVIVSDNTIAGHALADLALIDGENHLVRGNRLGTHSGGDHGSSVGIQIFSPSHVAIGGSEAGQGNVIVRQATAGIAVQGGVDTLSIRGNLIGSNPGVTQVWPNRFGLFLTRPDGGGTAASGIVVEENTIVGSSEAGIWSNLAEKIELRGNFIGVSQSGLPLPNATGVRIESGAAQIVGGTIARNEDKGIDALGESRVELDGTSVYLNGDGLSSDGLYYESPPFDPPAKVVALRSEPDESGEVTFIVAVAPPAGQEVTVHVYGNREGESQGRAEVAKQATPAGEPLVREIKVDPDSYFAEVANITATYTYGERTSSYSVAVPVEPIELPQFRIDSAPNGITLRWDQLDYYRVVWGPTPSGPWENFDMDPVRESGGYAVNVPLQDLGETSLFFRLELDVAAVFERQ